MVLSTLNQSFAFHSSPEAFISKKIHELSTTNPDSLPSTRGNPRIARASILNRQVHIISSYKLCRDVLMCSDEHIPDSVQRAEDGQLASTDLFAAGPAYRELMTDFFRPPNILLEDGHLHSQHKDAWRRQMVNMPTDVESSCRRIVKTFIQTDLLPGRSLDLYDAMKVLAWKLLLGAFLDLDESKDGKLYAKIESAQESLLRGQFSLFPVSINTPFWRSPRSKGLSARQELETTLQRHIHQQQQQQQQQEEEEPSRCPPLLRHKHVVDKMDISSHCILFTSSIANKALASLLTASVVNLFLMLMPGETSHLAQLLNSQGDTDRANSLRSILLETERLSPPVVGVMRRAQQELVLKDQPGAEGDYTIPSGHDVWLYFVGAGRDESAFENAEAFQFDRFMNDGEEKEAPPSFAFGMGRKTCLGAEVARKMISIVVEEMLEAGITLEGGQPLSPGVRAWLGWEKAESPEVFARDLKQLPCQRPKDPIWVKIGRVT